MSAKRYSERRLRIGRLVLGYQRSFSQYEFWIEWL